MRRGESLVGSGTESTYGTVGKRHSASKLNKVTSADGVVLLHEGNEVVDGVVNTVVGREVGLDGGEEQHRAVGTTTAIERTYISDSVRLEKCDLDSRLGTLALRDSNGVV